MYRVITESVRIAGNNYIHMDAMADGAKKFIIKANQANNYNQQFYRRTEKRQG